MFYLSFLLLLLLQSFSLMASVTCADGLLGRFQVDEDKWGQLARLRTNLKTSLADSPEWQEVHWNPTTQEPRRPQDLIGKSVRGARWDAERKEIHSFHASIVKVKSFGDNLEATLLEATTGTEFVIPLDRILSAQLHVKDQKPLGDIPEGRIPFARNHYRLEAMKAELVAALEVNTSWQAIQWDKQTGAPTKPLDLVGNEIRGVRVDTEQDQIHIFHARITSVLNPWGQPRAQLTEIGSGFEFSIPLDRFWNGELRVSQPTQMPN